MKNGLYLARQLVETQVSTKKGLQTICEIIIQVSKAHCSLQCSVLFVLLGNLVCAKPT